MKKSFTYLLVTFFTIILLGICGVGFIAHKNSEAFAATANQIELTNEILGQTEIVDALDENKETAARGYLLTNDVIFFERYQGETQKIDDHIALLRELVKNNQLQVSKVDSLQYQTQQKTAFIDSAIVVHRTHGIKAGSHFISGEYAESRMESTGNMVTAIEQAQRTNLHQQKETGMRSVSSLNEVFLILLISSIVLLIAAFVAIQYTLAQRKKNEEEIHKLNATLENRVIERTNDLLESEQKYRHLFENNPMPMWTIDCATFKFLDVNTAAIEQYGYAKEEFLSMTALDIRTGEERMRLLQLPFPSMAGLNNAGIWKHLTKDGAVIYADIISHELTYDGKAARLILANDVTEKRMAEQAIIELNGSLEKRVAERTEELQQVNEELESFSFTVSHDLRAPLRIINGYAKILSQTAGSKLDEPQQELIEDIMQNARHMGQLIDDLLNLSKMGRKSLTKRAVNMCEEVKAVVAEVRTSLNGHFRAEIIVNELKSSACDPNLMKQVWTNLISNAVKYSRKKEKPLVEIGSQESNGNTVYYVKDNGAGFDMQYASKLFGVFQRLHKSSEYEGTGVGLALVHRIVTKHGGKIWAKAEKEKGATFYFTLS